MLERLQARILRLRQRLAAATRRRTYWQTRAHTAEDQLAQAIVLPGGHRWPPIVERWRSLVAYYFHPEDVDLALGIINFESGGSHLAVCGVDWVGTPPPGYDGTPATRASGLFQQVPAYWPGRARAAGFADANIFDPAANTAVAAWLVYDNWGHPGAPHWQHWSGAHVGVQGSLEKARAVLNG